MRVMALGHFRSNRLPWYYRCSGDLLSHYPSIGTLLSELAGITTITDPAVRAARSRDFYWYSPILAQELAHCCAEVVVVPKNEAEVIRVAAACVRAALEASIDNAPNHRSAEISLIIFMAYFLFVHRGHQQSCADAF